MLGRGDQLTWIPQKLSSGVGTIFKPQLIIEFPPSTGRQPSQGLALLVFCLILNNVKMKEAITKLVGGRGKRKREMLHVY